MRGTAQGARALGLLAAALSIGCYSGATGAFGDDGDDSVAESELSMLPAEGDGAEVLCRAGGVTELAVRTGDGVRLVGDMWPSGIVGGPGIVLLHMNPFDSNRRDWPEDFIRSLVDEGITVLNVDRRGAGESGGMAAEADGPMGALDAVAMFAALTGSQCEVPADRIGFLAAASGTTSALDFSVLSEERDDVLPPAAIAWLAPGDYTENQYLLSDHTDVLGTVPMLFLYSDAEADYSTGVMDLDEGAWRFQQLDGGQHGTRLFTSHPEQTRTALLEHFADL